MKKRVFLEKIVCKGLLCKVAIVVAVFWLLDLMVHVHGVGETNYYYFIKFGNAVLFSLIWFLGYNKKSFSRKIVFSIIFGTWISFFYLISAYSGLVQFFGIDAYYAAPPFVIFGAFLPSFFWWIFHILAFYAGLEAADFIRKKR